MAYPHYRSQFGDTTLTKVFVGGLAWETPTEEMSKYFEQFGEILEAVIINDKDTGKSKGYGFVSSRLAFKVDHIYESVSIFRKVAKHRTDSFWHAFCTEPQKKGDFS